MTLTVEALYTKFEGAQKKLCYVGSITYSTSAFASTTDGDSVFVNARIVETLRIKEGEWILCYVLPNYEDKREKCQYRAIRAERLKDDQTPASLEDPPVVKDKEVLDLERRILGLIEENGPMSTKELADDLRIDSTTVSNICRALHRTAALCRADVYRVLDQQRASMVIWASHPADFLAEDD